MMSGSQPFRAILAVDFEFEARPGHNPEPICLVARELISGQEILEIHNNVILELQQYPIGLHQRERD